MTKAIALAVAIPFSFCLLVAPAQAQSVRTYVSSAGTDGNNCGRSTPCRTFQAAHDKTLPGGEITVLDQGNFATLAITKSISIVNEGIGQASILVGNGDTGLTINAPNANVNLRGLTIEGVGDSRGVLVSSVLSLTMTNCNVRNHTGDGIDIVPANDSNIKISNTLVTDNGGNGIYIQPSGSYRVGVIRIILNRVEVYGSGTHGIAVAGDFAGGPTVGVTVADSVVSHSGAGGIVNSTVGPSGANTQVSVFRSVISYNGTGVIHVASGYNTASFFELGGSSIEGNTTSRSGNGGFTSWGDNYLRQFNNNFPDFPPGESLGTPLNRK